MKMVANNSSFSIVDKYLHTINMNERIIETTIMVVIFLIGAIGNPVTAYVVVKNKRLHNLHNCLTINIIAIDSLATFTIMPVQIIILSLGRWPFDLVSCQLTAFTVIVLSTCALWTILWLSILRLLLILKPAYYAVIVLPRHIIPITISTWAVGFLIGSLLVALDKLAFKARFAVCFFLFTTVKEMSSYMMPFIVIPAAIVTVLSITIFLKLKQKSDWNKQRQKHRRQDDKDIANNYLMLVIVYIACYIPIFIIETETLLFKNVELPHFIYMLITFLGFLPFSLKTVAYMMTRKASRQTLLRFFKKKNKVAYDNKRNKEGREKKSANSMQIQDTTAV